MWRVNIEDKYFRWLVDNIEWDYIARYYKLLAHLHSTPFRYTIAMDGNRAADGQNLRYRFGRESGYSDAVIAMYLDNRECSVLEMMVALANRIFDQFIDDFDTENSVAAWFWRMIDSLGLFNCIDISYDERYVNAVLERFLDRDYEPNGKGGLFTIHDTPNDLRDIEIWYQMSAYIDTIL